MSALRDTSRFVLLLTLTAVSYLLIAEGENVDDQVIALGALALGMLAVVLIAYRFREDFEYDDGEAE